MFFVRARQAARSDMLPERMRMFGAENNCARYVNETGEFGCWPRQLYLFRRSNSDDGKSVSGEHRTEEKGESDGN